jgi:hypothetical protein
MAEVLATSAIPPNEYDRQVRATDLDSLTAIRRAVHFEIDSLVR